MSFQVIVRVFTLAAVLFAAASCDDEGPTFVPDPDCIDEAGGTVALDEEGDAFQGTEIIVDPGAWEGCWNLYVWQHTTFSTPNFPDGLHGHEGMLTGSLEFDIYRQVDFEETVVPPDSMAMTLSFPTDGFEREPGEVFTAFRYDDDADLWRLDLPDATADDRLVVNIHRHQQLWTWGVVDLADADFDLYVEPAMQEMIGTESWDEVQAELDELHEAVVSEEIPITCDNLFALRDLFVTYRDQSAISLRAFQDGLGGECGECDVTSSAFYQSIVDYFKLNAQAYIAQLMLIENSPHWLVTIFGHMMVAGYKAAIDALPCEFSCFFSAGTTEFYAHLAVYYVSIATVEVIEFFVTSGFIDC